MMDKGYRAIMYLLIFIPFSLFSQHIKLSIPLREKSIDINMETRLLPALDSLVFQISNNRVTSDLIQKDEFVFTQAIFEDVHQYESSDRDSLSVITKTLLNYYPIADGRYLCQIAYFKQSDEKVKELRMLLTVLAYLEEEHVTFSTPISYYTNTWKVKEVGAITYHYRDIFRQDRAEKFAEKNVLFSSRFKKDPQHFRFFMAANYQEIMHLVGFDYNVYTINTLRDGYGVVADEFIFSVMNNEDFSHDIFHYYSGTVHESSLRNWVTEEGLAYSWGNAYYTTNTGEMAEQKELIDTLKQYLIRHKALDLLQLFERNFWSDKSGIYQHLAPDFSVGRSISGVICDEVMRKHGMEGINQLITCGNAPTRFDSFFAATDELIGLNRKNFNKKVKLLIDKID